MNDYLRHFPELSHVHATVKQLRLKAAAKSVPPFYQPLRDVLATLPKVKASKLVLDQPVITIGDACELSPDYLSQIRQALKLFIPWKKGPYEIFGESIDAEWRSDWKWQRILPFLNLEDKRVADIGCHNGYFMFRAAAQRPKVVIGFEPFIRNFYNFQLLQNFAQVETVFFEPFGVEHMHHYENFFDTVLCLGILYHHHNPIGILRKIHRSMRASATLVVECQGIEAEDSIALVPKSRYANARGIWFLPSKSCLENWLRRAHFRHIECFLSLPLSPEEQRPTPWAPIQSLKDFLDPKDPSRTVEGYPAPIRHYFIAKK